MAIGVAAEVRSRTRSFAGNDLEELTCQGGGGLSIKTLRPLRMTTFAVVGNSEAEAKTFSE